jgi:hypothetical protein
MGHRRGDERIEGDRVVNLKDVLAGRGKLRDVKDLPGDEKAVPVQKLTSGTQGSKNVECLESPVTQSPGDPHDVKRVTGTKRPSEGTVSKEVEEAVVPLFTHLERNSNDDSPPAVEQQLRSSIRFCRTRVLQQFTGHAERRIEPPGVFPVRESLQSHLFSSY